MMPKSVVVSDSSCMIVLKRINRLILLQQLFEVIYITSEVYAEVGEILPDWIKYFLNSHNGKLYKDR